MMRADLCGVGAGPIGPTVGMQPAASSHPPTGRATVDLMVWSSSQPSLMGASARPLMAHSRPAQMAEALPQRSWTTGGRCHWKRWWRCFRWQRASSRWVPPPGSGSRFLPPAGFARLSICECRCGYLWETQQRGSAICLFGSVSISG